MFALKVEQFLYKSVSRRENVIRNSVQLNNFIRHRRCSQNANALVNSESEDNEFLRRVIYNDVLWQLKDRLIKEQKTVKLNVINQPICLKYLTGESNSPAENLSFAQHIKVKKCSQLFNLPYEVVSKCVTEELGSRTILNSIPNDVANFTRTNNSKITPPYQWTLNNELETGELINDNIEDEIKFGMPDPNQPISNVPCGGCGALLHCTDPGLPGFIPMEVFINAKEKHLRSEICQRCYFLKEFDIALGVNSSPDEYPAILSQIKNKFAMAIIMVDLLDFPCSFWPEILDIIGQKPVFIVGNKIDLLIQENFDFMHQFKNSFVESLKIRGLNMKKVMDIHLISAKTGYGVESLINSISKKWGTKGDMYLIGCTNVGKSTLFNALIQSDICRIEAENILQRATISTWPGTTLNLLKFPIKKIHGKLSFERQKRLIMNSLKNPFKYDKVHTNLKLEQTPLIGSLTRTNKFAAENFKSEFALRSECNYSEHEGNKKGIDPNDPNFKICKWCYDTPGVVQEDQIINILTTLELLLTLPKEMVIPRNFELTPGTTLFIAGLARLDYIHGPKSAWFTVFASKELPVTITSVDDADLVYSNLLGSNLFRVPCGGKERLSKWPRLVSKSFEIYGRYSSHESSGDIVLSSAGWVSVTIPAGHLCEVSAWTPEGRGIHLRKISVILKGHTFRGSKIFNTPAYKVIMKEVDKKEKKN